MAIDFETLDPEILSYLDEQEALLQQEKNKCKVYQIQLKKANDRIHQLKEEKESILDKQVLQLVKANSECAKSESAIRRESFNQFCDDFHYTVKAETIKNLAKSSIFAVVAIAIMLLLLVFKENVDTVYFIINQIICYCACASVGFFISDSIKLKKKGGSLCQK